MTEAMAHYQQLWQENFKVNATDWLSELRRQELQAFLTVGFPSTNDENWKYTNLAALNKNLFGFAANQAKPGLNLQPYTLSSDHYRLVFIDGINQSDYSILPTTETFLITDLATGLQQHSMLMQSVMRKNVPPSAFIHLNNAYLQQGVFIHIPANLKVAKPIQLLFLTSENSQQNFQNIRNIIVVGKNSQVSILEEHQGLVGTYFTNSFTQIETHQDAKLNYSKLQNQSRHSFHFANVVMNQAQNSEINYNSYHLGSQLAREDVHGFLNESGASLRAHGLYLPFEKQHIDVHTFTYHQADHTVSDSLFKGVVAEKSKAVFNGKISVIKDCHLVVANLQNKNLLLAPGAEVNTKPELEIYSNDVKCQHGATIGQIDSEMLFYLRSRGLSEQDAYRLLLLAFVQLDQKHFAHESIFKKIITAITHHCEVAS